MLNGNCQPTGNYGGPDIPMQDCHYFEDMVHNCWQSNSCNGNAWCNCHQYTSSTYTGNCGPYGSFEYNWNITEGQCMAQYNNQYYCQCMPSANAMHNLTNACGFNIGYDRGKGARGPGTAPGTYRQGGRIKKRRNR